MRSESTLGPRTASRAGSTVSAPTIATSTAAMPPNPIERRNTWGKKSSEASAIATVRPETATVRPAVAIVVTSADSVSFPAHEGFSTCIVLTTPPMPLSRKEVQAPVGLPLMVGDIDPDHLHLGEVGANGPQLVTAGLYGWTAVVTGTGASVAESKAAAYANAAKVRAPNMRYRLDIGDALIAGELESLANWGWLNSSPPERIASQIVR